MYLNTQQLYIFKILFSKLKIQLIISIWWLKEFYFFILHIYCHIHP